MVASHRPGQLGNWELETRFSFTRSRSFELERELSPGALADDRVPGEAEKAAQREEEEERQGLREAILRERGRRLPTTPREDCPGSGGLPGAGPTLACPGHVAFPQLCPSSGIIVLKLRCFLGHQLCREPQSSFWVHVRILLPRRRWPHGLLQHQPVQCGLCGQRAGGWGFGIPGSRKQLGDCRGLQGHGSGGSRLRVQVPGQEARRPIPSPPPANASGSQDSRRWVLQGTAGWRMRRQRLRLEALRTPVTRQPYKPHCPLKHPETGGMAVEKGRRGGTWGLMSWAGLGFFFFF